ncbi:MAG: ABC transporter substrate-binding protein [Bacteroidales bacterium]|nr:ABC transporter substrate-binding protein [Bacteroidales bacterium]
MNFNKVICLFICMLAVGCNTPHAGISLIEEGSAGIEYAKGFRLKESNGIYLLDIVNPWIPSQLLRSYVLAPAEAEIERLAEAKERHLIRIPIERAAIYSTVHTSLFEEFDASDRIMGICESRYLTSQNLQQMISEGTIIDLGESSSPNIEKIIDGEADIIIATPFENCSYGAAEKIGIPIFESADYMESTPLARSEWIKLFGILFGKREEADSIFNNLKQSYLSICNSVPENGIRPTLISEREYSGVWMVPGSDSYMVNIYKDAGADYIFSDIKGADSKSCSFEAVLEKGIDADIWVMKYYLDRSMTYNDLYAEYEPYSQFKAYQTKKIYTCNTAISSYYEDLLLHPDYILQDLVNIINGRDISNNRYYKAMEQ